MEDISDKMEDPAMDPVEEEIVAGAQAHYDRRDYQQLKSFIFANHSRCSTDTAKLKLLHLWEDGVYKEFVESRSSGAPPPEGADSKTLLSSSMRYKLRKKHPCPVELEQELRVKNARLPKPVHDGLNSWLKRHRDNPYPNKAEKEALSAKLGITPQQVNRWFIQRRKMLRIRGTMYLGRGITDTGSDDEEEEEEDLDGCDESQLSGHYSLSNRGDSVVPQTGNVGHTTAAVLLVPAGQQVKQEQMEYPSPLLEKILSSPRTSPGPQQQQQQQVASSNKMLCSGGMVEELTMRVAALAEQQRMATAAGVSSLTLTPPPSVSGESTSRATPPDVCTDLGEQAPLDLTVRQQLAASRHAIIPKTSPVILEPVSPTWKHTIVTAAPSSSELFYYKPELKEEQHPSRVVGSSSCGGAMTEGQQEQQVFELDSAERIAVNALLTLGKAK